MRSWIAALYRFSVNYLGLAVLTILYLWLWCAQQQRNLRISKRGLWSIYSIITSCFWVNSLIQIKPILYEMLFTVMGLNCFPWDLKSVPKGIQWHLMFAGLACVFRPAAIIYWIPLCFSHIIYIKNKGKLILYQYIPAVLLFVGSTLIKSYIYDRLIFAPKDIVKVNCYSNIIAIHDFVEPPYSYLFLFSLFTGLHTIPFAFAALKSLRGRDVECKIYRILCMVIVWTTLINIFFIPQEELQSILPLVPIILFVSSTVLAHWSQKASKFNLWLVAISLLLSNAMPFVYFGSFSLSLQVE